MKQFRTLLIVLLCVSAPLAADVKRESLHFLTTEAGVGYSALMNKSDLGKSSGLAGGKLQLGYEWNYRLLLVHAGVEFSSINDKTSVNPFKMEAPYTIGLPVGQKMIQQFDFQSYELNQYMGQINIPVQIGAVFANRYYFLAGARIGLPLIHSSVSTANVSTNLADPSLIGVLENVPVHDAYASEEKATSKWAAGVVNAQLSAEVGLVLNSFLEKPAPKGKGKTPARGKAKKGKPIRYRVALFADYGLTSCAKAEEATALADVEAPRQITFNDYYAASNVPVHSLLVGAKFAVLFQLNEQKPAKPLPSYFDIYIADAQTEQLMPASLTIYDKAKKRTVVKDAKKGYLKYRAKLGDYTLTASNERYYPVSMDASIQEEGITDTLRFALEPKPQPVVIDTPIIDIPIEVGSKIVLHNLFFATNQTTILPESESALNDLAVFMSEHAEVYVRITGHTDNVGTERDNQRLSEGRANAVRNELIKRGIASERIEAEGKGESEPIADNATEEGRAQNRRVEFTIIDLYSSEK